MNQLDLTGVPCPMNWVRTRLALEELAPGDSLVVLLADDGVAIVGNIFSALFGHFPNLVTMRGAKVPMRPSRGRA